MEFLPREFYCTVNHFALVPSSTLFFKPCSLFLSKKGCELKYLHSIIEWKIKFSYEMKSGSKIWILDKRKKLSIFSIINNRPIINLYILKFFPKTCNILLKHHLNKINLTKCCYYKTFFNDIFLQLYKSIMNLDYWTQHKFFIRMIASIHNS